MHEISPGWYATNSSLSEVAHLVPERQYISAAKGTEAFCGAHINPEMERPHWRRCVRCVRKVERLRAMVDAEPPPATVRTYTIVVTRPQGDEIDKPFIDMLMTKFKSNRRIEISVMDANPPAGGSNAR